MKRLILMSISLLLICFTVEAADSKVSSLPGYTVVTGDEYMYIVSAGASYKIKMDSILYLIGDSTALVQSALEDSCSDLRTYIDLVASGSGYFIKRTGYIGGGGTSRTLVPKDGGNFLGLYLGYDPTSYYTAYTLYNAGKTYLGDTLLIAGQKPVFFNSSTTGMARSGDNIIFWDVYQDTVTLTQLAQFPSTLTQNTTVNTATYDLKFVDGSNYGYFYDYSENTLSLSASTELQLTATDITMTGDVGVVGGLSADYLTITDSIELGSATIYNSVAGANKYQLFSIDGGAGIGYMAGLQYAGSYKRFYMNAGGELRTWVNATIPTVLPHFSDPNTGLTWISADLQGFISGGTNTFSTGYTGSTSVNYLKDSAIVTNIDIQKAYFDSVTYDGGTTWFKTGSTGTGGTYDSSAVWGGNRQYVHIFDTTGTKYDSVLVEIDSSEGAYIKYLTSDQSSTGTTLAEISDLSMNVEANHVYLLEYDIVMSGDATGGIKFQVAATGSRSWGQGISKLYDYTADTLVHLNQDAAMTTSWEYTGPLLYYLSGSVTTETTTSGVFSFQFAQSVANGTSYIRRGSWYRLTKIE